MASKPILFSTPMVQAILEGRKTQTRRVCKALENYDFSWGLDRKPYIGDYKTFAKVAPRKWGNVTLENVWLYDLQTAVDESKTYVLKLSYQPSDILWVRETWAKVSSGIIEYKADYKEPFTGSTEIDHIGNKIKWRPSIHMPRKAARIFLRVTNVRVERLQDIAEEDALKEGAKAYGPNNCSGTSARIAFAELWDGVYNNWRENPWVFVYEFERVSEDGSKANHHDR